MTKTGFFAILVFMLGLALSGRAETIPSVLIPVINNGRVECKLGTIQFFGERRIEKETFVFLPKRPYLIVGITFLPRRIPAILNWFRR